MYFSYFHFSQLLQPSKEWPSLRQRWTRLRVRSCLLTSVHLKRTSVPFSCTPECGSFQPAWTHSSHMGAYQNTRTKTTRQSWPETSGAVLSIRKHQKRHQKPWNDSTDWSLNTSRQVKPKKVRGLSVRSIHVNPGLKNVIRLSSLFFSSFHLRTATSCPFNCSGVLKLAVQKLYLRSQHTRG